MGIVGRQDDAASTTTPTANYASIQAVVACTIVMSILSTFMVGARMAIRWSRFHLGLEDWLIIMCMVCNRAIPKQLEDLKLMSCSRLCMLSRQRH